MGFLESFTFMPCLTAVLVFVVFLTVRYKKAGKQTEADNDAYLDRAHKASISYKKGLGDVNYITIPLERFPLGKLDDDETTELENQLKALSQKPIANFSRMSNVDLMEQYGANHFEEVAEIGEGYEQLSILLVDYARKFVEKEMYTEAVSILEFAMATKSDVASGYILLGQCYHALGQENKLQILIDQIPNLSLPLESKVLSSLREFLA